MTPGTIEPEQQTAARVAGFSFLFLMIPAMFAEFYARGSLIVSGDAAQTAINIAASERLFRLGIVGNLITFAGDIVLILALYVVLRPVSKNLALLATFWRLVETAVLGVIVLNDFTALLLLGGADYLRAFDTQELQALARLFISVQAAGYRIGMVFLGLGSTVFSYLFFKSRYIPRWLAAWGLFASSILALVTLALMIYPQLSAFVVPAYFAPMFLLEVILGGWLLFKGIRSPQSAV